MRMPIRDAGERVSFSSLSTMATASVSPVTSLATPLSPPLRNRPWKRSVRFQPHHTVVAQERRVEILQRTAESEDRILNRCLRECYHCRPSANLIAIRQLKFHVSEPKRMCLASPPQAVAGRRTQDHAEQACNRQRKHRVVRPRVEDGARRIAASPSDPQSRSARAAAIELSNRAKAMGAAGR